MFLVKETLLNQAIQEITSGEWDEKKIPARLLGDELLSNDNTRLHIELIKNGFGHNKWPNP